jgi:hypothetical protein
MKDEYPGLGSAGAPAVLVLELAQAGALHEQIEQQWRRLR